MNTLESHEAVFAMRFAAGDNSQDICLPNTLPLNVTGRRDYVSRSAASSLSLTVPPIIFARAYSPIWSTITVGVLAKWTMTHLSHPGWHRALYSNTLKLLASY